MNFTNNTNITSTNNAYDILGTPANPTWGGLFITLIGSMIFISFIFILFAYAISNYERYKKVKGWAAFLLKSTAYFAFGILTLLVMAIPFGICYYFIDKARHGNVLPIWITLSLIVGYIIIALIGWLSKKYIIDRIKSYEKTNIKHFKKWIKDNPKEGVKY
jgi:magnesium-transporting ATPase (P-type)